MIESKAPKCPGCGRDMELFQIAAGGWRYGCIACATSFKAIKRKQYGWISPIKSTKERAYAAAALATEPKWISVKDKLPENLVDVLVWFEYFRFGSYNRLYRTIGIGSVYNGQWGFINGQSGWQQLKVIAWMPLPEPPKEE